MRESGLWTPGGGVIQVRFGQMGDSLYYLETNSGICGMCIPDHM
jgi:hypothetical protein